MPEHIRADQRRLTCTPPDTSNFLSFYFQLVGQMPGGRASRSASSDWRGLTGRIYRIRPHFFRLILLWCLEIVGFILFWFKDRFVVLVLLYPGAFLAPVAAVWHVPSHGSLAIAPSLVPGMWPQMIGIAFGGQTRRC
jgi:hypothetical protein